ncbi:MAG: LPS export ABC transporter permease LptF, partial [Sphingomicrobium sp.]
GRLEPALALWLPLALMAALIGWMYHVIAHQPGGQPIGALERGFAIIGKRLRALLPRRAAI